MIGYWITSFDDRDFIAPQEVEGEDPAHMGANHRIPARRLLESYGGLAACRYPSCKHAKFKHEIGGGELTDTAWAWPANDRPYV